MRLVLLIVLVFLALVLAVGLTVEYIVNPSRPVATVNDERITLREWQNRVRYERAQLIDYIESIYELFGEDPNQVLQFAGQQVNLLARGNAQVLGNQVLQQMIDEELIRQEAEARGASVTDQDVQARIETFFNYYGGAATRPPEPTATVMPTPSVTPILPAGEGTDPAAPTATPAPTSTPPPTATPVSAEGFTELFNDEMSRLSAAGVDESLYRSIVAAQVYREALQDDLGADVAAEAEQANVLFISYATESEALQGLADVAVGDFLTVWNTVRSSARVTITQPLANEVAWATLETMTARVGEGVANQAFELPVGTVSEIVPSILNDGTERYFIIQVTGREVRPLPESTIDTEKSTRLNTWLEEARLSGGVTLFPLWEERVPERPALDAKYYRVEQEPATAAP